MAHARRLAGTLFAVWRDGLTFKTPGPLGAPRETCTTSPLANGATYFADDG